MTVAYADFVTAFPEFGDATKFPQAQIDLWISLAPDNLVIIQRRAKPGVFDLAVMLFVAHNLVISTRETAAALKGIPGETPGLVSSKTVDKVSVSYDAAGTAVDGAGAWNATFYGQRLYKMMQAYAAGPVYAIGRRVVG